MKTMKYDINKENSLDDQNNDDGGGNQVANACLQCFKVCFKKKANFGLEDLFWLSFLILIIILSVVKSTTRIGWSQFIYVICGSVLGLIVVYISASVINKLCFDDAATAHWNAHARFTQAAMAQRLAQEEHKVHVIAPPRMGGAKLNIFYTVGDVPIVTPQKGIQPPPPSTTTSTPTDNSCPTSGLTAATTTTTTTGVSVTQRVVTGAAAATAVDSPPARESSVAIKNNASAATRAGGGVGGGGGDLSPKYELPEPPTYAKTSATLYEEVEKF